MTTDVATETDNRATFLPEPLPEPEPRVVENILISVDDHVIEPPDTFAGRMPAASRDRAPLPRG